MRHQIPHDSGCPSRSVSIHRAVDVLSDPVHHVTALTMLLSTQALPVSRPLACSAPFLTSAPVASKIPPWWTPQTVSSMGCSRSQVLFREESTIVSSSFDPMFRAILMMHYRPTQFSVPALPSPLDPLVTRSTLGPCGGELLISRNLIWIRAQWVYNLVSRRRDRVGSSFLPVGFSACPRRCCGPPRAR